MCVSYIEKMLRCQHFERSVSEILTRTMALSEYMFTGVYVNPVRATLSVFVCVMCEKFPFAAYLSLLLGINLGISHKSEKRLKQEAMFKVGKAKGA